MSNHEKCMQSKVTSSDYLFAQRRLNTKQDVNIVNIKQLW